MLRLEGLVGFFSFCKTVLEEAEVGGSEKAEGGRRKIRGKYMKKQKNVAMIVDIHTVAVQWALLKSNM